MLLLTKLQILIDKSAKYNTNFCKIIHFRFFLLLLQHENKPTDIATMTTRLIIQLLFLFLTMPLMAQSGLNKKQFNKYWTVESESPDYKVTFRGDTCELLSPKGLTLWRKQQLATNTIVEYDAQVVVEHDGDRLSDLNCFWLASDPQRKDIWRRQQWRSGIFLRCYTLQMYYLGYGGNHNSTTRFRRYDGDERGVDSLAYRPTILKEYTDAAHLLRPNHWYHVKIESSNGRTRFYIDDELFLRVFRNPEKYIPFLCQCEGVIGPDMSQYTDMPAEMRYRHAYCNAYLSMLIQKEGGNLYPNITWSKSDSYWYSYPENLQNSVIAINSNGVHKNGLALYRWRQGYNMALIRLSPQQIIRYGQVVDGENTMISTYHINERLNMLKNGCKRK